MPLKGGAWGSDWAWVRVAIRRRVNEAVRANLILKQFCRVMRYSVLSDEQPLSPMEAWGCTRTLPGGQRRGHGRLWKGLHGRAGAMRSSRELRSRGAALR